MIKEHVLALLRETTLFGELSEDRLKELADHFEPITVYGGDTLVREGEQADALFLVASGHLSATQMDGKNEVVLLRDVGRGELIGELSLLTQRPRAATVFATRDSILLRLSKTAFDEFFCANPSQILPIARAAIVRLTQRHPKKRAVVSTIAVLPADEYDGYANFAATLTEELTKFGSALHVNSEKIKLFLAQHQLHHQYAESSNHEAVTTWLAEQEDNYRYVIYEADKTFSDWTQRCIREADRIVWVGHSGNEGRLNDIEIQSRDDQIRLRKKAHLVLVQGPHPKYPHDTARWSKLRPEVKCHHLPANSATDLQRIVRIITSRSIGLVLGGGGATGLAHIGVYKALHELGVPIDWLGGASSGAGVAGFCAMGCSPDEVAERFYEHIFRNKKKWTDYTVPLLSLFSGFGIKKYLSAAYGPNLYIEDLWKNFFCTASNLTQFKLEVIQEGLLWKAVRASTSLPAVLPPVSTKNTDLLVDGGVMNNLPVDIMQQMLGGGKIIAVSLLAKKEMHGNFDDGCASGWQLLWKSLKSRSSLPFNVVDMISRSIALSSEEHSRQMAQEADCCINISLQGYSLLGVEAMHELVDAGYHIAMQQAESLRNLVVR